MRWVNHKVTAFGITYAISNNLPISLLAAVSSILPDALEFLIPSKHRGIFHMPLFWIIIAVLSFLGAYLIESNRFLFNYEYMIYNEILFKIANAFKVEITIYSLLNLTVLGIMSGAFLHLLADSLSATGIPIWKNKMFALDLYRTFTFSELYISGVIFLICAVVILFRKGLISI